MKSTTSAPPQFLLGGGEMGALIRAKDWTNTPLGAPAHWPQSLRTSLSILLNSGYPMFIWWGTELTMFHNDAYLPVLGKKHPQALGRSAREMWSEIWGQIGGIVEDVFQGKQFYAKDLQMFLGRKGFLEETYWTFSYSPIFSETGEVCGLFCACNEETEKIVRQRRLKTLKEISELSSSSAETSDMHDLCYQAVDILAQNSNDIPFAALYLLEKNDNQARLVNTSGSIKNTALFPTQFCVDDSEAGRLWRVQQVIYKGEPELIPHLKANHPESADSFSLSSDQAIVLPLRKSGQDALAGFLICGLSSALEFEEEYATYLNLVSRQIATGLANAQAYAEERRRAEALAELDRAKTVFFNNISHEFRTPLTLMLGPLQEALGAPERRLEAPQLDLVYRNTQRLLKLVNTLLDFSRIEAGRIQSVFQATQLPEFTAGLAGAFRYVVEKAGLKLEVHCEELPEAVYVDQEMWEKILNNLLSNAFKYTFTGSISVYLKALPGYVQLQVADTGVGIPEEELPLIFNRFYRGQNHRGRTHEGTGIGLSLVRELVLLHGGDIQVESQVDHGSVFTIRIPFGSAHLPQEKIWRGLGPLAAPSVLDLFTNEMQQWSGGEIADFPAPQPLGREGEERKYLLVVDDNADMRAYLQHLLLPWYEVHTAGNGRKALEMIKNRKPDLVVADLMMPEIDGLNLVRMIRQAPSTADLPVILLSARAGKEAISEGLYQGADDYLEKPFSARELFSRIDALLRRTDMRSEAEMHFKNLLLQAPLLICFLKGEDLIIDAVNEKFRKVMGNDADLLGRPFREALPDFQKHLYYDVLDVYQSGVSKTLKNIELLSEPQSGSGNRVFDFTCQALRETDGYIAGVTVVATDVTYQRRASEVLSRKVRERTLELTRANQTLQKQKEFVDAIIDASVNLISVYDREKNILSINKQVESIYGLKREEVIGKPFSEVFPGGVEAEKQLDRCLQKGETIHNPVYKSVITGRIFESFVIPLLHPNGEVYAAISMAHDNTQFIEANHKLHEAERKNKELEQFAYLASHDLQEPLSTITSFISLMEEEEMSPAEMSEYFSHIKNSSRRLSNLITDLLEYSRIGHQSRPTLVDFQLTIDEVLADMQATIQRKQARIQVGRLPALKAYPTEIRLLFQNLISNALKFQESESIPNIEIQARKNGVGWHFVVSDNGIGMEEQFLDRVFIIFQRLHPSSEYEGTGIGLAHCKKIIDLHGGRIWVESTPRLGSTFHFIIPDGYETD